MLCLLYISVLYISQKIWAVHRSNTETLCQLYNYYSHELIYCYKLHLLELYPRTMLHCSFYIMWIENVQFGLRCFDRLSRITQFYHSACCNLRLRSSSRAGKCIHLYLALKWMGRLGFMLDFHYDFINIQTLVIFYEWEFHIW